MPLIPPFAARALRRVLAPLLVIGLAGCGEAPPHLYVLTGTSSAPAAPPRVEPLVGVVVQVPDYLDRLDMVERTSANEIRADYNARWGEDLAVTASRALTADLTALAPGTNIIMLPLKDGRRADYRLRLDLTQFETTADGTSVLTGDWIITDSTGREWASGSVSHTQPVPPEDPAAGVAAMSRNLAAAAAEIAGPVKALRPAPTSTRVAKFSSASANASRGGSQ
jgi:uncharacterized lipoprotein YmbA